MPKFLSLPVPLSCIPGGSKYAANIHLFVVFLKKISDETRGAMSFPASLLCPGSAGIQMLQPPGTAILNEARGGHQPLVLWVLWRCPVVLACSGSLIPGTTCFRW